VSGLSNLSDDDDDFKEEEEDVKVKVDDVNKEGGSPATGSPTLSDSPREKDSQEKIKKEEKEGSKELSVVPVPGAIIEKNAEPVIQEVIKKESISVSSVKIDIELENKEIHKKIETVEKVSEEYYYIFGHRISDDSKKEKTLQPEPITQDINTEIEKEIISPEPITQPREIYPTNQFSGY
jgi:hypothetical protein